MTPSACSTSTAREPPLPAAWGRHDPFFILPGAETYRRDIPDAETPASGAPRHSGAGPAAGVDGMVYMHHIRTMTTRSKPETDDAALVGEVTRDCLLTRTRRISRVITSLYDEAMRPHGVNSPQFSLLVLIAKLGGASRAEIGRANFQERSTLTRNLALLLAEGWIEELASPGRGRSRPIAVSAAGRALLASALPAWRSAQVKARQLLGEQGAAALAGLADSLPPDELGA